jgi:hypothetical protein
MQGGQFGIGTGTHDSPFTSTFSAAVEGTFSNLCERRLAFELSTHPTPEEAINALIHRVIDVSERKGGQGFITCPQLGDVIRSIGLSMSAKEVEVLATGE